MNETAHKIQPDRVADIAPGPNSRGGNVAIRLADQDMALAPEGALYWLDEGLLVVADLHLEKGSSFARRRVFLPPYDTAATLARLTAVCARLNPRCIIALGDSFHDREADQRLDSNAIAALRALQTGRDWIWVSGNHDPHPPTHLGGEGVGEIALGPIMFRHEPSMQTGVREVAGHLHPAAKIRVRGRSIRRHCFMSDDARMILPAFGAYTGGLNVRDSAFAGLFAGSFHVWMLGDGTVYRIHKRKLLSDS